jgi:RNA polymerase sigma-70 factor (ECF subfamily)
VGLLTAIGGSRADAEEVAQVAELLHVPTGTVKSRLSRARAAIAPMLADEERSAT